MKIHNSSSVAILMATYNGERYLNEQIESLQRQTFEDWSLYIQDDGSSDQTLRIINEFAAKDHRIRLFDIGLSRQGAGMNFLSMLNVIESEYYMFCDQDDVWFPDKIDKTMERMKHEEALHVDKSVIVHTSRTFTDEQLHVKLQSEFNPRGKSDEVIAKKIELMKNPNILRIYTIVGGCTMMLNHKVKEQVFPYCNVRVHDSVCVMAVANHGGVISTLIEPTMFYRLHSSQTCGVRSNKLLPKLLNLFSTLSENMRGFYIWKIYGGGNFFYFLYWRIRYFFILRFY
jgi:rhamnosyltransferase